MPGRKYVCGDRGHHFGTPEGEATNTRALMRPSCGSIDLTIVTADRTPRIVMRAVEPAKARSWWRRRGTGGS